MQEIDIVSALCVFLGAVAGGLVQTATGFGLGIVVMLIFPLFLPLLQAAALAGMIGLLHNILLIVKHRRHIKFRETWAPVVIYSVVCALSIYLAKSADMTRLKAYFGVFLVAVSLYFMLFEKKVRLRAGPGTAIACSCLSGAAGGLFGIGGPPMVPYFLSACGGDKLAYLATIQFFFALTNCTAVVSRVANGIITTQLLWYVLPAVLGVLPGTWLGTKIISRINAEQMKKLIYIFLGAAGVLTFIVNIR